LNAETISLDKAPLGTVSRVTALGRGEALRRMLDLGLVEGASIEPLFKSPSGGTMAYFIRGAVIALRSDVAAKVLVKMEK